MLLIEDGVKGIIRLIYELFEKEDPSFDQEINHFKVLPSFWQTIWNIDLKWTFYFVQSFHLQFKLMSCQ